MKNKKKYGQNGGDYPYFERLKLRLSVQTILRCVKQQHQTAGDLHICDIGCGFYAPFLEAARPYFKERTGVDFVTNPALQEDGLHLLQGDGAEVLGGLPGAFDMITFLSVMEHVEDRLHMTKAARNALKPGGILYINSPSWFGKWVLEHFVIPVLDPDGKYQEQVDTHRTYFDQHAMWQLLRDAGFVSSQIHVFSSNFGCSVTGWAVR